MRPLRYARYRDTVDEPNVVVDGSPNASTVLTLSHWPGTDCPDALRADLSAEMTFRYLDRGGGLHGGAEVVTNNHFDEDGVVSVFVLTAPDEALARRDLLIDVARAGDFGWFRDRRAARASMTITALGEQATGDPYDEILAQMTRIVDDVGAYRALWTAEDERLTATEAAIAGGAIRITEHRELDLAIVTTRPDLPPPHEMAVHNATGCFCLAHVHGQRLDVAYRYETWVLYQSRRPRPRVELDGLAARLTELEPDGARWEADDIRDLMPGARPAENAASGLDPNVFVDEVVEWTGGRHSTWAPYG
jgi:hypothetical protein